MNDTTAANQNYRPAPTITHAPGYRPALNRPFAIKNLFHAGEVVMIAGAPGLGKTNITAAACAHVAQGRTFGGRAVRNSVVIYYAAEDPEGVLARAHPYLRAPECAAAPFYVVHGAPNLLEPQTAEKVRNFVERKKAEHNCDCAVVVFDTLNRCIGGADENLASTMGAAIETADQIAKASRSCVVLVHHVGASNPNRPRGSTAQQGNIDNLYILQPASGNHGNQKVILLNPIKQKNISPTGPMPFRLESFSVGRDNEGDEMTLPYAVPLEDGNFSNPRMAANRNGKIDDAAKERRDDLERVLADLHSSSPSKFFSRPEIAERSGAAFNAIRSNKDSLRKAISRALDALVQAGVVEAGTSGYRYDPPSVSVTQADETA